MLLGGLVPDLGLSMRQTEAVQRAVGLGVMKVGGSQRWQTPPGSEAADGAHLRLVILGVIPDSIMNVIMMNSRD